MLMSGFFLTLHCFTSPALLPNNIFSQQNWAKAKQSYCTLCLGFEGTEDLRDPIQPPATLPRTQDLTSFPWGHLPMPQKGCNRAVFYLPVVLPSLDRGLSEPAPNMGLHPWLSSACPHPLWGVWCPWAGIALVTPSYTAPGWGGGCWALASRPWILHPALAPQGANGPIVPLGVQMAELLE